MTALSPDSYWNATADPTNFPSLMGDIHVDVAIIGGGIVGITAARLLKDRGQTVAVIEARRVGQQVTGKSTAKVTSQHGLIYQRLVHDFSEDRAQLYADAQQAGVRKIVALCAEHRIDADMETKPAYCWTVDEDSVTKIEKEVDIAVRLGLPASFTRDTGLPFDVLGAIRFDDQAQFHPTRYIAGLAQSIVGDDCHIFENSRVVDWEPTRVVTDQGSVTARCVVMATHLPLGQVGGYYTQAAPHAEPVIVVPFEHALGGMFISAETPQFSLRSHVGRTGQVYGIAAGPAFKPGDVEAERQSVAELEQWLTTHFGTRAAEYRWINEDYTSIDGAPYVGWSNGAQNDYLVATGFGGWGISNGTAAAMVIADLATGAQNPWTGIFDAARIKPITGAAKFLKDNLGVAKHLVGGYLTPKHKSFDDLSNGAAAILKIDGDNIAAFRDDDGVVHSVSAVCSHMGCLVGWNETDRTWDCPCHGSRFDLDGAVIHGPATRPLGSPVTG